MRTTLLQSVLCSHWWRFYPTSDIIYYSSYLLTLKWTHFAFIVLDVSILLHLNTQRIMHYTGIQGPGGWGYTGDLVLPAASWSYSEKRFLGYRSSKIRLTTLCRFLRDEGDTREWDSERCRRHRFYIATDDGLTGWFLIILIMLIPAVWVYHKKIRYV